MSAPPVEIHPATPERWDNLVEVFGPSGGYGGCWCMWNRQTSRQYEERKAHSALNDIGSLSSGTPNAGAEEGCPSYVLCLRCASLSPSVGIAIDP